MRWSPSRPSSRAALVGLVALGAVAATACGASADTTAAKVGDETISIEDVNRGVDEPAIVGPNEPSPAASAASPDPEDLAESRQSGDIARAALAYEIRRATWTQEAKRWGATPTAEERAQAESQIDAQLAKSGVARGPQAGH